jgi:hypothetical protein
MPTIYAQAVTLACDTDDCYAHVQAISDSRHQAFHDANTQAEGEGWESYAGTNGGTFWRCPQHSTYAAVQFFYENAPWSYDPRVQTEEEGRTESAEDYAAAEQTAREKGWELDTDRSATTALLIDRSGTELASMTLLEEDPSAESQRIYRAILALEVISTA